MEITQEMIDRSAKAENDLIAQSPQVLMAQNQHLNQRVVVLRALVDELQKEIDTLKGEKKPARKAPADRRPPAKKATTTRKKAEQ